MQITQDDLLEALRAHMAQQLGGEEGMTVSELSGKLSQSDERVRRNLKALLAQGKAQVVSVRRTDMAGRMMSVPGYRLVP